MSSIPHDDRDLKSHWCWMTGNEPDGFDSQPDGDRWVPTQLDEMATFDRQTRFIDERRDEREVLALLKQPLMYEPADLDADEEFAVSDVDLAYQRGFACGFDGHLASAPDCLATEDETAAWTEGWSEGYYSYINELERDYVLGHPDPDPDPWNEAHSPLAGHPAGEN